MKKLILILILGIFIVNFISADLSTGLVSHWTFDDGSGTNAINSVDTTMNATLKNGANYSSNARVGSYAVNFDGANDYADFANTPIQSLQAHTISFWIQRKGNGASYGVFFDTGAVNSGIDIQQSGTSNSTFSRVFVSSTLHDLAGPDLTGDWDLITETWNTTTHLIYFNGVLNNSVARSGPLDSASGALGLIGAILYISN